MLVESLERRTLCASAVAAEAAPAPPFSRGDLVGGYEGQLKARRVKIDLDAIVTRHENGLLTARIRMSEQVYEATGTASPKGKVRLTAVSPDVVRPGTVQFTGTMAKNGVSLKGRLRSGTLRVAPASVTLMRTSAEPRVANPPVGSRTTASSDPLFFAGGAHGSLSADSTTYRGGSTVSAVTSTFAGRFIRRADFPATGWQTTEVRNYFVFDLPAVVKDVGETRVVGAKLLLERGTYRSVADAQTFALFEVTGDLLAPADQPAPPLFGDLGEGTSYGSFEVAPTGAPTGPNPRTPDSSFISLTLNAAGLDAATAALAAGKPFAFGGRNLTVTDPSLYNSGSTSTYDGLFFSTNSAPVLQLDLEQIPVLDATTPPPPLTPETPSITWGTPAVAAVLNTPEGITAAAIPPPAERFVGTFRGPGSSR